MRVLLPCGWLALALALVLVLDSSVQDGHNGRKYKIHEQAWCRGSGPEHVSTPHCLPDRSNDGDPTPCAAVRCSGFSHLFPGLPLQRARYQWVRCTPDSIFANCIDETGPVFNIPLRESNRIPPPRTDPFSVTSTQNVDEIFPLSEDYSGSGSGSGSGSDFLMGMEHEYQPADKSDASYYDFKPVSSDNPALGQNGLEENFIM